MLSAKNYNNAFESVKVIAQKILLTLFSGHHENGFLDDVTITSTLLSDMLM